MFSRRSSVTAAKASRRARPECRGRFDGAAETLRTRTRGGGGADLAWRAGGAVRAARQACRRRWWWRLRRPRWYRWSAWPRGFRRRCARLADPPDRRARRARRGWRRRTRCRRHRRARRPRSSSTLMIVADVATSLSDGRRSAGSRTSDQSCRYLRRLRTAVAAIRRTFLRLVAEKWPRHTPKIGRISAEDGAFRVGRFKSEPTEGPSFRWRNPRARRRRAGFPPWEGSSSRGLRPITADGRSRRRTGKPTRPPRKVHRRATLSGFPYTDSAPTPELLAGGRAGDRGIGQRNRRGCVGRVRFPLGYVRDIAGLHGTAARAGSLGIACLRVVAAQP